MKILFITDPSPFGGTNNALIMLTHCLKKKNCDVTVCISKTPELEKHLKQNGISTIRTDHIPAMINRSNGYLKTLVKAVVLGFYRRFYNINKAKQKVEKAIDISSFDIIHTNSSRSDLGCLISNIYKIPHVVHLREFGIEDFNCICLKKHYYEYLNFSTDFFISVSNAVKKSWINKGIDQNKIVRIYDGINIRSIKTKSASRNLNLRLVIVGGIVPTKGQHLCIKAINELPNRIKDKISLDIIGWEDYKYRKQLNGLVSQYGLEDKINFLGIKEGVGDVLCNYDIGIMASRSEGFGLVTAEYMAAGLCVVASNSGANAELISNGDSGLLFENNNYISLSQCIERLFNDRDLLNELALKGYEKACKDFTIERNADEILKLYQLLVSKNG